MSARDSDLAKLAGLRGWRVVGLIAFAENVSDGSGFKLPDNRVILIPTTDDPLPEKMAFAGELCAELPDMDHSERLAWCAAVLAEAADIAPGDVAWVAVRHAIVASGGTT